MAPILALLAALAATPERAAEELPGWVVLEALNPDRAQAKILLLDELLRGDGRPAARALLVLAADLEAVRQGALKSELEALAAEAAPLDGWVLVLLRDTDQALTRARGEVPTLRLGFVVAADGYGIARHALKLDRPGERVVVNSSGRFVRISSGSPTAESRRLLLQALRRDKEDGR